MDSPYVPNIPRLQAIAIAYRNTRLIADAVMPYVPVSSNPFEFIKFNRDDRFTLPNTRVGRRSAPNQVEFGATDETDSCEDFGLDAPVPQADIDKGAAIGMDPLADATLGTMDLILLDREKRVADLVFAAATYPAANKVTLAGTSQWSDYANSTPIDDIQAGIDALIMRPNLMVLGHQTASVLRRNPDIVKAYNGTAGDAGMVPLGFLRDLFEVDVQVGQGWLNTAKPGQASSMARVWGKHCALLYQNPSPAPKRGVTFGFTARFGDRIAGSIHDEDIGLRGGERVRVGEMVKELVVANDVGYFIQNAVA